MQISYIILKTIQFGHFTSVSKDWQYFHTY